MPLLRNGQQGRTKPPKGRIPFPTETAAVDLKPSQHVLARVTWALQTVDSTNSEEEVLSLLLSSFLHPV